MMYHKFIGDREVFSDGSKIEVDGVTYYNPTSEMMLANGWEPYTPPSPEPIVPQPQTAPNEWDIIQAVKRMLAQDCENLSDEEALAVAALFPTWHSKLNKDNPQQEGKYIALGERLWDDGELWKCITPHNALLNWRPKDSPSLFTTVSIEEWPPIPSDIPSTNPWMAGMQGTWKGQHYKCVLDNCTWNPDQYAAAWELVP